MHAINILLSVDAFIDYDTQNILMGNRTDFDFVVGNAQTNEVGWIKSLRCLPYCCLIMHLKDGR